MQRGAMTSLKRGGAGGAESAEFRPPRGHLRGSGSIIACWDPSIGFLPVSLIPQPLPMPPHNVLSTICSQNEGEPRTSLGLAKVVSYTGDN